VVFYLCIGFHQIQAQMYRHESLMDQGCSLLVDKSAYIGSEKSAKHKSSVVCHANLSDEFEVLS
jgi:hypothetical protein